MKTIFIMHSWRIKSELRFNYSILGKTNRFFDTRILELRRVRFTLCHYCYWQVKGNDNWTIFTSNLSCWTNFIIENVRQNIVTSTYIDLSSYKTCICEQNLIKKKNCSKTIIICIGSSKLYVLFFLTVTTFFHQFDF